jgi:hypothetical protein
MLPSGVRVQQDRSLRGAFHALLTARCSPDGQREEHVILSSGRVRADTVAVVTLGSRFCGALCIATTMCACSMIVSGQLFPGVTNGIECGDPPTTPTSTPPIIDTVMTGLLIVGTVLLVVDRDLSLRDDATYLLLVPTVMFGTSAAVGFQYVGHCQALEREYAAPIDCAAVKATADELRARGGGTIRDTKFLNSIAVHRCFGQSPAK